MKKYVCVYCSCENRHPIALSFLPLAPNIVMPATQHQQSVMESLLKSAPPILRFRPGELVEGTVIFKGKNKLLLDLHGVTTAIISGRELRDSFNTFRDLQIGSGVIALVLEEENDEGLVVMSLRKASQQKAWDHFHDLIGSGKTMPFTAQEANKGGLLVQ